MGKRWERFCSRFPFSALIFLGAVAPSSPTNGLPRQFFFRLSSNPRRNDDCFPFLRYLKNRTSIRADVVIVHQGRCALSWPRFSNGVSPVTLNRDHVPAPICFPTLGITLAAFRFVRPSTEDFNPR